MADDNTDTNDGFEDAGIDSVQDILRQQAMDQESLLIIDRALQRDQQRRAEFMRDQEREFIDARDKRRTQIEEMVLAEANALKRDGVSDSQLIPELVASFFRNVTPQETFPEIAAELQQERNALPLGSELQFFEENAPEAFAEFDPAEREKIIRMEAQFREHNDLPPLSESIKQLWGDPETRGKILKYGSYGVMAAVLIGSGGAAAPAMVASKMASRMTPYLGKAVDRVSHAAGRTLVRHGVISPKTYASATEKMLALSNKVKTNKFFWSGKMVATWGLAMAAGAAGADAAGLFDSLGTDSAASGSTPETVFGAESSPDVTSTNTGAEADAVKPEAAQSAHDSSQATDPVAKNDVSTPDSRETLAAGTDTTQANAGASDTARSGYKAPNVLAGEGSASGWAPNVLDGGVDSANANPSAEATGSGGSSPEAAANIATGDLSATESNTNGNPGASGTPDGTGTPSLPAGNLVQAMKDAGLSTTQVEMFYGSGELSGEALADIVELSDNPVGMMQVLASQGVDIAALDIEAPEVAEQSAAAQYTTSDLAVDPATLPPIEVTVEKYDTLSEVIAEQLREQGLEVTNAALYGDGVNPGLVEQIASHNAHISDPDLIYPGDTITLPMDVLHGKPMVEPTLAADALGSVDDVVAGSESIPPSSVTAAPEVGQGPDDQPQRYTTPAGAAHDLAGGQFDLNMHIKEHLNANTPPAEALDPTASAGATKVTPDPVHGGVQAHEGGVAQDLANGQFDVVDRVNEHLAGYEPPAQDGGIAQDLANGQFDVAEHVNESLQGTNEALVSHQEVAGPESAGGWRERLAGAMGKAKAFVGSFGSGTEPGIEAAATDASGAESTQKSNWEVLTEAAEKAKSEWAATQGDPSDSAMPEKGAPEEATTNDKAEPKKESGTKPMYANHDTTRGPGM